MSQGSNWNSERGMEKMAEPRMNSTAVGESSSWWALYTRHQHEKVVADMLSAKGLDVFLPLYKSVRRWKDRQKHLWMPLFPCYVFVRGGLAHRLSIVTTPGVHMVLSRGEQVAIIPDEEMQAIRLAVGGPYRIEPHPLLKCGDRMRITRGSLKGVEGILVRKKNIFRLVLTVEMLAQSVAVEIDALDVEPVQQPNADPALSGGFMKKLPQPHRWGVADPAVSVS